MVWMWLSLAIAFFVAELVILNKYAACISLSALITCAVLHITRKSGANISAPWQIALFVLSAAILITVLFLYNRFIKK